MKNQYNISKLLIIALLSLIQAENGNKHTGETDPQFIEFLTYAQREKTDSSQDCYYITLLFSASCHLVPLTDPDMTQETIETSIKFVPGSLLTENEGKHLLRVIGYVVFQEPDKMLEFKNILKQGLETGRLQSTTLSEDHRIKAVEFLQREKLKFKKANVPSAYEETFDRVKDIGDVTFVFSGEDELRGNSYRLKILKDSFINIYKPETKIIGKFERMIDSEVGKTKLEILEGSHVRFLSYRKDIETLREIFLEAEMPKGLCTKILELPGKVIFGVSNYFRYLAGFDLD